MLHEITSYQLILTAGFCNSVFAPGGQYGLAQQAGKRKKPSRGMTFSFLASCIEKDIKVEADRQIGNILLQININFIRIINRKIINFLILVEI